MSGSAQRHAHMVDDLRRTQPLLRAISNAVKKGDIVIDIGTGLGLLAIHAAKCGAKHVFAIDCDQEALDQAKRNAKKSGVAEKISFIYGLSFDFNPPKHADLILCETVGSFAFDENICATISDAKKRLLKRGGGIIPEKIELWGAPCGKLPKLERIAEIARINRNDLCGPPTKLSVVEFAKKVPSFIHIKTNLRCTKTCVIRSIVVWPKITWLKNEITDAGPYLPVTHWKQGILQIEPKKVLGGESARLELIIKPHQDDPKKITERMWRVYV